MQLGLLRGRAAIGVARAFERRCYRAADGIVALSEGMAEWILRLEPAADITVVPNASNPAQFGRSPDATAPARDPALVVCTGTLGRMDDCGQIVEAARVLQQRGRRDIRLVLLGDGQERSALVARAEALGLTNLEFRGLVPKLEVVEWLHRATCALVTFRNVPVLGTVSPNKLFDAFAASVPVVQTTQGWICRLLERERCGVSVPADDPEAMADAIASLVDDPARRGELAANAGRVARELFNCDGLAETLHAALQRASTVVR